MWRKIALLVVCMMVVLVPGPTPLMGQTPMFQEVTATVFGGVARVAQSWGQIAVLDYDRDGDDDMFLHEHYNDAPSTPRLMRNNGNGTFTEMPNPFPPVSPDTLHRHVWLACDINLDGKDDLIVGTGNNPVGSTGADPYRDLWLRNDTPTGGAPVFTDITLSLGTGDNPSNQTAGTCVDYQNDGDLDVMWSISTMLPARPGFDAIRLWVNDAGVWRVAPRNEIGQSDGINGAGAADTREDAYQIDCGDFQNDGDQDCLNVGVNTFPWTEGRFMGFEFFNCEGGAPVYEFCSYMPGALVGSYGGNAVLGEFTGDGKLDAYIQELSHLDTCNDPNFPTFEVWSEFNGRLKPTWKSPYCRVPGTNENTIGGVVAADFDNDGDLDVFAMMDQGGPLCFNTWAQKGPDRLWINNGTGTFTNAFAGSGLDGFMGQCGADLGGGVSDMPGTGGAAAIDYDEDGRVDLIVGYNEFGMQNPFRVYRNVQANNNQWIGLKLRSPAGSSPLGAKVEARRVGETAWRTSFLTARTAWLSQSSRNIHIGLGPFSGLINAEVRITWPNGAVQNLALSMNQYHIVTRP